MKIVRNNDTLQQKARRSSHTHTHTRIPLGHIQLLRTDTQINILMFRTRQNLHANSHYDEIYVSEIRYLRKCTKSVFPSILLLFVCLCEGNLYNIREILIK